VLGLVVGWWAKSEKREFSMACSWAADDELLLYSTNGCILLCMVHLCLLLCCTLACSLAC